MDTALAVQSVHAGGFTRLIASSSQLREAILLLREMLPIVTAKGGTRLLASWAISLLPAWLLGGMLRHLFRSYGPGRFYLEYVEVSGFGSPDSARRFAREVLIDAQRFGIPLPRLRALDLTAE